MRRPVRFFGRILPPLLAAPTTDDESTVGASVLSHTIPLPGLRAGEHGGPMNIRITLLLGTMTIALFSCAPYSGQEREVSFRSTGNVELRGSLVFPDEAPRPVPAVVLLHGSEPATRSFAYRMHANIFLERGLAVLLYDKRGAGESGGNHDSATYGMLIEDALAAIDFLRTQEGINPDKIGMVGASESGWFTPEIAERAGNIAFVINKVGSALSWRETVEWEYYNDVRDKGVEDESAREQAALRRRMWDYYVLPDSTERVDLEAALREWSAREDSHLPEGLQSVSASYVQDIGYDPTPFLERLSTPILYVFGSDDMNIPTARCVVRLEELQRAGRPVTFYVYRGEGHELGGIGLSGYEFVDGYSELLGDFVAQNLETTSQAGQ